MNDKFRLLTIGLACVFAGFPQVSMAASPLKNSEFLVWNQGAKESFIQTSVLMASLIVGQTDRNQGDCISQWYAGNVHAAQEKIYRNMRIYIDAHPSSVILAVMEKYCGEFSYTR